MTDHFGVCEDAALKLVADEFPARFTSPSKQIAKANDSILTGGFDFFLLSYPGILPTTFAGTGTVEVTWEILIDLMVRWNTNESLVWVGLKSLRSDLFNLFNLTERARTLNRTAGVKTVLATFTERPRYIPVMAGQKSGAVAFVAQVMSLNVTQYIDKE